MRWLAARGKSEPEHWSERAVHAPQVVSLVYSVSSGESVTYRDPPPLAVSFPGFSAELKADVLTCTMTEHYASVESARTIVEEYLRGWEIHTALTRGHGEISFAFRNAQVIDRDRTHGSGQVLAAEAGDYAIAGDTVSAHVVRRTYPAPEPAFRATPDVLALWRRYEGYLAGREPLQAMAYFCLTVIEGRVPDGGGGGRERLVRWPSRGPCSTTWAS